MTTPAYLPAYYDIREENGRFAFEMNTQMAGLPYNREVSREEMNFRFDTRESANRYAAGYIRRNFPRLMAAAKEEAAAASAYQRRKAA